MIDIVNLLRSIKTHIPEPIRRHKKPLIIGGAILALLVTYALIFFIPKPMTFSYASTTCANQFLLFPDLQKSENTDTFAIESTNKTKVGTVSIWSTKVCVKPLKSPSQGSSTLAVSPWGGPIFAKQFALEVPKPPVVSIASLKGSKIAAARPLTLPLSNTDAIHTYSVLVNEASAPCAVDGEEVKCDVPALKLEHGKPYTLSVNRAFAKNEAAQTKVGSVDITTLEPVIISNASVSEGQTIYDVPTVFTFDTNRPLSTVKAKLATQGDSPKQVEISQEIDGTKLILALEEALDRKKSYTLTLEEANGTDGSTLAEAVRYNFSTSGGPKVSGVSIGAGKVGQSERVVVTFDQPINEDVDVAKFVKTNGTASAVARISPTQVALQLSNAPLCTGFEVEVLKGIKSGSNNETADEGWKHSSRVTCGIAFTAGYSVKGRAIVAYRFGSGTSTIMFTGGIHGNERSSQQTMQGWVDYLMANAADVIPADKSVVIVPNLNPDGIASGSRNNANNVNLGRNYPSRNWSASIETANGVLPTGGGTSAGSEPETKAIMSLTRQLQPRLQVSFHSQGRLVGANKTADSVNIGNIYASTVGYGTMYHNAEAVMGYSITGEYEDWMGESMGIPAILIELPSHYGNYLNSQLPALLKMLKV